VGLVVYALPFFWQALTSLKPEAELMVLPPLLPSRLTLAPYPVVVERGVVVCLPPLSPSRLTLEHYRVVLERSVMVRAMVNSLGVGAITTALALTLGLGAAHAFARRAVPGKRFLLPLIVAGTAFPQIATVSPLYLLMRALELRDTWLGLILANASFALPLVIWLLL